MMGSRQQIKDLLAEGPCSAGGIANKTGLKNLSVTLNQMAREGWLDKKGLGEDAIYSLTDRKAKPHIGRPGPRTGSQKRPPAAAKKKQPAAPTKKPPGVNSKFTAAMTADERLVILTETGSQLFSVEETLAIADMMLKQFNLE